jgi:FixJ family two-component response regulator
MQPPLIAVVDDDHSVRKSLSGFIRSAGLAVQTFASAEEFLSSEALSSGDCAIVDVHMPGMSGLELQRRLALSHPRLPVVIVTAEASNDEVRLRALKDGAIAFLSKPLSGESVLSAIQTALKKR